MAQPAHADSAPAAADPAKDEHPLSWHGITIYGAYDIGVGWVSHGMPENGSNYEGEALVNRNAGGARVLIAPNNLSQTGLGIRAKEEILPGWYAVFNANTGINPQSGKLADSLATDVANNGLPRAAYAIAIDGARAGQAFNDEVWAGISSDQLGQLTFGRQRSLGTDAMLQYDPASGAYAFSYIGYNGTMAGGGDTEDSRWDDAVKYRVGLGALHLGAMAKFADGSGGCYSPSAGWTATTCTALAPHNSAYGFDAGVKLGEFAADVVFQHYNQAISVLNPLLGPTSLSPAGQYQSTLNSINTNPITGTNLIGMAGTVYGIVTDNTAIMVAARYTLGRVKLFAGYEHILYKNPANPLGIGATAQGGYVLSGVEDNNLDSNKITQIGWGGIKYAWDTRTDLSLAYYRQGQNTFRVPAVCTPSSMRASCSGTLQEASAYVDHHFTRHFDLYGGLAWSHVAGGLAIAIPHGPGVPYTYTSNVAPTVGGRFTF